MPEEKTYTAEEVKVSILEAWIMLEGTRQVEYQMQFKENENLYKIVKDHKAKARQTIQQFLPEFLQLSRR